VAGFFGNSFVEKVRGASDIVEVIGSYFPLKRAGASWVALCPFHREKSPSFHVSPGRQGFHCFGCHKGGDVFRFVQEYENVTFGEAVERLAQRAGIALEYERGGGEDQPGQRNKEALRSLHEQIAQRWQSALNEAQGEIARNYLAKRGVSPESIQLFRLGYAPDAWDDTVNWCKSKGHDIQLALQAGLVVKKEETGRHYDRFRGRLMFPICDEQGRVIAFSGRILQGDEKSAKYVNSPETPIFTKGRVFYGLDKTKRAILDAGFAILCEGQLDLIACFQGGVKNIVAPQGTAFTSDHARILKRHVEEVVLCFDSDNAGQNAATRILDSLLGVGMSIRVAVLPAPHDPDSLIKEQGGDAFAAIIRQAPGFFDFYLDRLCRLHDPTTDRGRLNVIREMGLAVQKTGNAVTLDAYVQKTGIRLSVSQEAVRREFLKLKPGTSGSGASNAEQPWGPDEEAEQAASPPPSQTELWLLKLLVCSDETLNQASAWIDLAWVQHGLVRRIVSDRLTVDATGSRPSPAQLMGQVPDDESRQLISQCAVDPRPVSQPLIMLRDVLMKLRNQSIDREMEALKRRLEDPATGDEERARCIHEREVMRRRKTEPLPAPLDAPG